MGHGIHDGPLGHLFGSKNVGPTCAVLWCEGIDDDRPHLYIWPLEWREDGNFNLAPWLSLSNLNPHVMVSI